MTVAFVRSVYECIERSACDTEETDSSCHSVGHSVRTLSKFFNIQLLPTDVSCMVALLMDGGQYLIQLCFIIHCLATIGTIQSCFGPNHEEFISTMLACYGPNHECNDTMLACYWPNHEELWNNVGLLWTYHEECSDAMLACYGPNHEEYSNTMLA